MLVSKCLPNAEVPLGVAPELRHSFDLSDALTALVNDGVFQVTHHVATVEGRFGQDAVGGHFLKYIIIFVNGLSCQQIRL